MTELKTPTAVLHEGPRTLSEHEIADIERRDLTEIRQVDIDDVIEPQQTRPKLIRALRTLQTKRVAQPQRKHGNIPL